MKRYGSMTSQIHDDTAHEIYLLLQSINTKVDITYISSSENFRADNVSRDFKNELTEWSLDSNSFQKVKAIASEINVTSTTLFAFHFMVLL